jgi:DNA-directed RNA polymerase subunit RPC12/RpoP
MNESNEPRCPQCGSWRTYELPAPWPGLMNFVLGRAPDQPRQLECLKCHHRWIAADREQSKAE